MGHSVVSSHQGQDPDPAREERPEEQGPGISTRCGAAPLPHSVGDLSRDQSLRYRDRDNTQQTVKSADTDMSTLTSLPAFLETQKVCLVFTESMLPSQVKCCHLRAGPAS